MKFLILTLLSLCVASAASAQPEATEVAKPPAAFVALALQGNLSAFKTDLESGFGLRFRRRFIDGADDIPTERDPVIRGIIGHYRTYWRTALLNPEKRAGHEESLKRRISAAMNIKEGDAFGELKAFIGARGYHSITGRTPPLMELIVWRRNRKEEMQVELTDGEHSVPVTYMEEFISYGWSHFATFGRASTGGWTDRTGLYCVADSYDLTSEKFRISFLKHEARHYVDYALYPKLQSADLEYRAKLTELAYGEEILSHVLRFFSANAARTDDAPHSLANWYVMRGLSERLAVGNSSNDPAARLEKLLATPAERIHAAARELLAEHDKQLAAAGPKRTPGVLTP